MTDKKQLVKGYVKTENMILTAMFSLAIGFLLGVVFTVYRSGGVDMSNSANQKSENVMNNEMTLQIEALEEEAIKHPDNATTWSSLGHLYFDTNQIKKAIQAYEKSIAINPDNADIWTDLGVMYRRDDKPEKSIESFDKAIEINPGHEISRFNKGIVLFHDLNDKEKAIAVWKSLIEINPNAKAPNGQLVSDLILQFAK